VVAASAALLSFGEQEWRTKKVAKKPKFQSSIIKYKKSDEAELHRIFFLQQADYGMYSNANSVFLLFSSMACRFPL